MIYLRLFLEFFKVGLFAVGGGQATIPFLTDMAIRTEWFTVSRLLDMIAISESTPGPIGVNMATYVGYETAGLLGSICATIGLVFPSVVIILIVARLLQKFRQNKYVDQVFYGIKPASTGLIGAALYTLITMCIFNVDLYRQSGILADIFNLKYLAFFVILIVLTNIKQLKKLHPVVFVILGAVVGVVFKF